VARASGGASRLDTGLLVACLALSIFALAMPARLRDSFATALRRTALSPMIQIEKRAATARAAIDSRDSLLVSRGGVATTALVMREIDDENRRLRELLGLAARLEQGYVVADVIPGRGRDDQYSLVLSVGSSSGVQPFTPVVTADGLVGMVQSVDALTSYVITLAHPDFHVSAMSVDEQALGIVQPHLGSGAERWLLEMRGVAFRTSLDTGTLVVTAGLATHPRGMPIGTVIGEVTTTEKWARTYLLRPAALPSSIGPVIVLLPARVAQGVNTIWGNVASADSAARAVADAGDSLARKAALDELAARRAAIDSTVADSMARDSLGRPLQQPLPGAVRSPRADSIRRDSVRRADSIRARARADSIRRPPTGPPPPLPRTGPPPPSPSWQ
jgi:rod shape-determining protein MreC